MFQCHETTVLFRNKVQFVELSNCVCYFCECAFTISGKMLFEKVVRDEMDFLLLSQAAERDCLLQRHKSIRL